MHPDYPGADCEKTQAPPPRDDFDFRLKQRQYAECGNAAQGAGRPMTSAEILAELFHYHPPTSETIPKFAAINQAAKNFAEVVLQNCPAGADRSSVISRIQDARMVANRAIAVNGLSL
jgi:hypothetical protein